jgi:hypothetical protein
MNVIKIFKNLDQEIKSREISDNRLEWIVKHNIVLRSKIGPKSIK